MPEKSFFFFNFSNQSKTKNGSAIHIKKPKDYVFMKVNYSSKFDF